MASVATIVQAVADGCVVDDIGGLRIGAERVFKKQREGSNVVVYRSI